MSYATTDDVAISLGRPLSDEEVTHAEGLLVRVETRILRRIPDLASRIDGDDTLADVITEIEADAVARVLRNPSGMLTEQDGDYMYTRLRSVASGELGLTDDEWSRLGLARGAFAIRPSLGLTEGAWPYRATGPDTWTSLR